MTTCEMRESTDVDCLAKSRALRAGPDRSWLPVAPGKTDGPSFPETDNNEDFVNSLDRSYGKPNATAEEDLKWHFVAHTSLDVFEEREASGVRQNDHYTGLLQVMDDYAVYGYQTSTRVKFVLTLALTDETVKDNDIKTIFKAIHNAYLAYLSNPFNDSCSEGGPDFIAPPIKSKHFEQKLHDIALAQDSST